MKVDLYQFIATILGSIISGFLLFAVKDLISTIRGLKKELNDLKQEHVIFRTAFDLFKERTDAVPGLKENLVECHKRITILENLEKGKA